MDITGSWSEADFARARESALGLWDVLRDENDEDDQIAMTLFTNRFSWAYTELSNIDDVDASGELAAAWGKLNIASKGGMDEDPFDGIRCALHPRSSRDAFIDPEGGCYPDMPREYTDEPGTDHWVGLKLAEQLLLESFEPDAYKAVVVMTDGRPASGTWVHRDAVA